MKREAFYEALKSAAASHPAGACVEIKDINFYLNNKTALFYSENGDCGAAVSEDGELTSVFKKYKSGADITAILEQASAKANHLSCFASGAGEKLVKLYEKHGFKTIERIPFNPEYAPANWPEKLGKPDCVYMKK